MDAEMPVCAIMEWNQYLDWELSTLVRGIMGALPAARAMADHGGPVKMTDPEEIGKLFDGLNAMKGT